MRQFTIDATSSAVVLVFLIFLSGSLQPAKNSLIEDKEYPAISLRTVSGGRWVRPRAELSGVVTLVRKEDDGDWHFRLEDDSPIDPDNDTGKGHFIICEIIPELPMPNGRPKVGDGVTVRGVVRFDGEHKWWELHPVTAWKLTGAK